MEVLQLWREKASWKLGTKEYHKVIPNLTQEIYWERQKSVTPSAWVRGSRQLSWRQVYLGFLRGGVFQGGGLQGRDW